MAEKIKVLIAGNDPGLHARAREVSERVEVVTGEQLRANPALLEEIEVAYGGVGRAQVPGARRLRWIQTTGAGVNGLIGPEVRERDITITTTRGIHAEPIAEHMFGMLLMVTRCLAPAWDQQKTRKWRGYDFGANLGILMGKTLGILGVGAIGGQCAKVGKAFGMRVVGMRRSGRPHEFVDHMYSIDDSLPFYRESDVVMNILPLTEQTRHTMSWDEFAALKPGAIVVNAGRGATINTDALLAALRAGRLGAALLDVTDPEPLPEDHPLWSMERVFITPHYAGAHPGYNERGGRIFLDNLRRYLAGEPMINVVDRQAGY